MSSVPMSPPYLVPTPQVAMSQSHWGAIMTGVLVAVSSQFVLTTLGIAIGMTAAVETSSSASGIGIAAGVWWLVTGCASLFVGGTVYGRVWGGRGRSSPRLGAVVLWSVVAAFGFLVVWSGMGMAYQGTSPFAAVLMEQRSTGSRSNSRLGVDESYGARRDRVATDTDDARDLASEVSSTSAVESARTAKIASWWSMVGLLAGLVASVVGAEVGVRHGYRIP